MPMIVTIMRYLSDPMKRVAALVLLFTLWGNASLAQEKNFSVDDGLPSDQVYDIIEDDYGYIWFSTDQGLSRFNGYTFENFDSNDGLTDNVIFDFKKLDNGDIWCTTLSSTLFVLRGEKPSFTPYPYNDTLLKYASNLIMDGLLVNEDLSIEISFKSRIDRLKVDAQGNCIRIPNNRWDSGYIAGVVVPKPGRDFFYQTREKQHEVFSRGEIIKSDDERGIPYEGVFLPKRKAGAFVFFNHIELVREGKILANRAFEGKPISSGLINDSVFWVSFSLGGVRLYDDHGKEIDHLLKSRSVTRLYKDSEDNIWLSTLSAGVFFYAKKELKMLSPVDSKNRRVNQLYNDKNGDLYISYYCGGITSLTSSNDYRFYAGGIRTSPAFVAYDSLRGEVSAYANAELFLGGVKKSLYARSMMWSGDSLFVCGSGVTFVYKNVGGVAERLHAYPSQFMRMLKYEGEIYAASLTGLYRLSRLNKFEKVDIGRFSSVRINAMEVFDGQLVLGTSGQGVIMLDDALKMAMHLNKEKGVSSNFISNLSVQNDSTLWVSTNNGANRLVMKSNGGYRISSVDKSDGLLSNQVWDIALRKDTVWIGTSKGVNYAAIDNVFMQRHDSISYSLSLKSFLIMEDALHVSKNKFSYDENEFKFFFSGTSLSHQDDLVYRYKLKGLDNDWAYTRTRTVQYPFLPPGKYTFLVQAKGSNAFWEMNEESFSFEIHLPFWKQWWFLLSIIFSISLLIYLFFRYRILSYNRDIIREIIRQVLKRVRKKEKYIIIRQDGQDVRIITSTIVFIKSSGNYLEIQTDQKKYVARMKIGDFLNVVPDSIEFLRVHRSYIIRLDKLEQKSRTVLILGAYEVPVGRSFWEEVDSIQL